MKKVNNLNFCRQMIEQFTKTITQPGCTKESIDVLGHCVDMAQKSQKFILPDGGRIYDDPQYRALDEKEPLRLPFPFIALEYERTDDSNLGEGELRSSKAIVLAREQVFNNNEIAIVILPIMWIDRLQIWGPLPEIIVPSTNYINRSMVNSAGYASILVCNPNPVVPIKDYGDELGSLLCFINVLHCRNVHIESNGARKLAKNSKSTLPFDSYYILKIDQAITANKSTGNGTHRSPREHLRRGHIRRLATGARVWVNATVVCAGSQYGSVSKDYLMA